MLDAESILDGRWAEVAEEYVTSPQNLKKPDLSNKEVGICFDHFLQKLGQKVTDDEMSQIERECLEKFLRVLHNLRPHLIQCYDLEAFPRTNNEMERSIGKTKTSYRRVSGRKNWGTYLLRYGRTVAFYAWWEANPERWQTFEQLAQHIDRTHWKEMKEETISARNEQLLRFRFRHRREAFLASLELRWATASETITLH